MARNQNILIFSGKYGEEYFDASTDEARNAAFLHVLRSRKEQGWYYEPEQPGVDANTFAFSIMTDEQIDALPEAAATEMRAKREKAQRTIASRDAEYREERAWWDQLEALLALPVAEAIAHKTGRFSTAEWLANERGDYEYEGYDFESFTPVATS